VTVMVTVSDSESHVRYGGSYWHCDWQAGPGPGAAVTSRRGAGLPRLRPPRPRIRVIGSWHWH
jgi:hypothetical protein